MAEPRTVRENANSLTSEEIAAILPHRYPFALVDRILDYEPGQWGRMAAISSLVRLFAFSRTVRGSAIAQPSHFLKARQALCPPKPRLLLRAYSIFISRPTFGT